MLTPRLTSPGLRKSLPSLVIADSLHKMAKADRAEWKRIVNADAEVVRERYG